MRMVVQVLSGTGGGRIAFEFMARFVGKNTPIYMPDPTWANHLPMAKDAGLSLATYRCFVQRMHIHPECGYRCARFFGGLMLLQDATRLRDPSVC